MLYPLSYGGVGCEGAGQTVFSEHAFGQIATLQLSAA